jgi:hypothetical protein
MKFLPDPVYQVLKWLVVIVIPAAATLYVGLAAVWGWPYADEIAKTAALICAFIGALIGVSQIGYNKSLAIAKADAEKAEKAKDDKSDKAKG